MKYEKIFFEDNPAERKKRAAIIQNLPPRVVAVGEPMDQVSAKRLVQSLPPTINEHDGRVAIISGRTIGKLLGHKGYDFSRIIVDIAPLYKTSVCAWSEQETLKEGHKPHNNLLGYHNYVNKFTDGTSEYYIRFTLSEEKARHGKIGRSLIHSAAISNVTIYKKSDHSQRTPVIDWDEGSPSPFIDNKNDHSQRISIISQGGESPSSFIDNKKDNHSQHSRVIDPVVASPSSFIDKKLQAFFDLYL